jgi:hypothetical protein
MYQSGLLLVVLMHVPNEVEVERVGSLACFS